MEVVSNSYMPGDPRLIQQLVCELKSQGIFDQFRKECISDVDTKPAYQNLRQRVEGSVTSFLKQQTWRPDMNKNQVREQLRKSIYESGYLETGVERIVDQVVNPKINTVFLPQVEDVVYRYLGIEKPNRLEIKKELKIDVTDLLPTDLEAISPESDHMKDDSSILNDSLNLESKLEEDESPPFEPLDVQLSYIQHEENSVDSHMSGFSGLQSHDSNEAKTCNVELLNQDSQVSRNSSESRLSIVTSEDNTKMEICEDSDSKLLKSSDSDSKIDVCVDILANSDTNFSQKDIIEEKLEVDQKDDKSLDEKIEKKSEDEKLEKKNEDRNEKRNDDKKSNEKKSDDRKHKSSDKYNSRDKKDDKYRKSSRDKEKTSSKHSSSSSSKEKDKSKDRRDAKNSSSTNKDKSKTEKEKDRSEKEKSSKEKDKSDKEKDKTKSSSGSSKHNSKDKDRSSSSSKKESSSKDKEKVRSSSSSTSKDSKSKPSNNDSKSKSSSTDKHKKDEKYPHNGKHSSSSSSTKKDRDKKRDSKKDTKDDHYSSKEKRNERRSTDRDSNDGQSSRQSQANSFLGSNVPHTQKNSQESTNSNSGSGSGDSGNSDQIEHTTVKSPTKLPETLENRELEVSTTVDVQKFKYTKPKFASNFQEARKIMKIRKQLAKLERQNQLSLAQIEIPVEVPIVNGIAYTESTDNVDMVDEVNEEVIPEAKETPSSPIEDTTPVLQSTELSKENWEALEARLAQEMSNINYNSYESPYDDGDYCGYNSIVISPKKNSKVSCEGDTIKETPILQKAVKKAVAGKKIVSKIIVDDIAQCSKTALENNCLVAVREIRTLKIIVERQAHIESRTLSQEFCDDSEHLIQMAAPIHSENKEDIIDGIVNSIEGNEAELNISEKGKMVGSDCQAVETDSQSTEENREHVENTSELDDSCRYLEELSPSFEKELQFLYKHIEKLEKDVEHSVKASQNNFLSLRRVRSKRKREENVDLKNNNKAHYEPTIDSKKRKRSLAPNPNSLNSMANKEKMCNSADISPNDSFSLPLSPAESDKSNDKKEEELQKPVKQKRLSIGKNTRGGRTQRYSSEDLYKPRPIFASSRRSRGANNPEN